MRLFSPFLFFCLFVPLFAVFNEVTVDMRSSFDPQEVDLHKDVSTLSSFDILDSAGNSGYYWCGQGGQFSDDLAEPSKPECNIFVSATKSSKNPLYNASKINSDAAASFPFVTKVKGFKSGRQYYTERHISFGVFPNPGQYPRDTKSAECKPQKSQPCDILVYEVPTPWLTDFLNDLEESQYTLTDENEKRVLQSFKLEATEDLFCSNNNAAVDMILKVTQSETSIVAFPNCTSEEWSGKYDAECAPDADGNLPEGCGDELILTVSEKFINGLYIRPWSKDVDGLNFLATVFTRLIANKFYPDTGVPEYTRTMANSPVLVNVISWFIVISLVFWALFYVSLLINIPLTCTRIKNYNFKRPLTPGAIIFFQALLPFIPTQYLATHRFVLAFFYFITLGGIGLWALCDMWRMATILDSSVICNRQSTCSFDEIRRRRK